MICPNCKSPVAEHQEICDQCGFQLAVVDEWLGVLPRPGPGLTDASQVLEEPEREHFESGADLLRQTFPQVRLHAILLNLPTSVDLRSCIFWFFNRGDLCPEEDRNGHNHHILFLLDTANGRVGCMVGYGLEPFVGSAALGQIARNMENRVAEKRHAEALDHGTESLLKLLLHAHGSAVRGLGLEGDQYTPGKNHG